MTDTLSDDVIADILDDHSDEELFNGYLMEEFCDEHGREPHGSHEYTNWLYRHFRRRGVLVEMPKELKEWLDATFGQKGSALTA
jgi:hypothetical protein